MRYSGNGSRLQRWMFAVTMVILTSCHPGGPSKKMNDAPREHRLRSPLVVYYPDRTGGSGGAAVGVLPTGTSLVYVRSFPEGFDRYHVYVNVERAPLPLSEVSPPDMIDPLSSRLEQGDAHGGHATTEEIRGVLRALKVTRADLEEVIRSYDGP
jgi:hypothetical protein